MDKKINLLENLTGAEFLEQKELIFHNSECFGDETCFCDDAAKKVDYSVKNSDYNKREVYEMK